MTYEYTIENEGQTKDWLNYKVFAMANQSIEEVELLTRQTFEMELPNKIHEEFLAKGFNVNVIEIVELKVWSELRPVPSKPYEGEYRLYYKYIVRVTSDRAWEESPVAEWVWILINKILIAIGVICFLLVLAVAIGNWLKAMTTTRTVIRRYDDEGNLIEEEERTEPSIFGIGMVGLFLLVGFFMLLMVLFGMPRGKKG